MNIIWACLCQFDTALGTGSTHLARQAGAWNGAA
jgi:hypothetical protein